MTLTAFANPLLTCLVVCVLVACSSSTQVLDLGDEEATGGGGGGATGSGSELGGGLPAGTGGEATGCTSNLQCIEDNGGLPFVCKAGTCVSVLSEECQTLLGGLDVLHTDDMRLLGALLPLSGDRADLGRAESNAIDLAIQELNAVVGGLPAESGAVAMGALVCDETVDPIRAAAHLVNVGAVALIGPSEGEHAAAVATQVTIEAGVLSLSPRSDDPALASLDDGGLAWQLSPSVAASGVAIASVLTRVEADMGVSPLRVAVVAGTDARSQATMEVLLDSMTFNGVDAAENANGGNLRVLAIEAAGDLPVGYGVGADVVIVLTPQLLSEVVPAVEGTSVEEPTWIAGPVPEGFAAPLASPDLAGRAFGVRVGLPRDRQAFQLLSIHYSAEYGTELPEDAAAAYDAAYALFYAMVAAGEEGRDGAALATALGRLLSPGTKLHVGPGDLSAGMSALASGGSIDLDGASGSLDLDIETGEAPRVQHVLCNDGGGLVESGAVFDLASQQLEGTSDCL